MEVCYLFDNEPFTYNIPECSAIVAISQKLNKEGKYEQARNIVDAYLYLGANSNIVKDTINDDLEFLVKHFECEARRYYDEIGE